MIRRTLPALLAATLLCACSKSAPSASAPASTPSLSRATSPAAVAQAAKQAKAASLPQPNWATPDSEYVEITKGTQVMFLDAAFSGLPPNYDKMAQAYSSDYRNTSDDFKKHDLLAALQPKLDAGIADAKAHPYITWTDDSPNLGHYDFNQHGFSVGTVLFQSGHLNFYDANYNLAVTNGRAFRQLQVADEAKARAIEALVGKWPGMHLRIYAFAQSTDESGTPTVQALVTKVQLLDSHNQVLFEQTAQPAKG